MHKVTVVYHCEDGGWWAESSSPGLETFVAGGGSLEEAKRMAREGLEFHLGGQVKLTELFEPASVVTYLETYSEFPVTVSGGPPAPGRPRTKVTIAPAQPCAIGG
jgi:predicted RNase H-like HicB family nuclease